jgi:hypothetical protein
MIVASDGIWEYISSQVRVNELSMWSYNDLVAIPFGIHRKLLRLWRGIGLMAMIMLARN